MKRMKFVVAALTLFACVPVLHGDDLYSFALP